jgi:FAD/FMN-containing dehydrogenase
MEHPLQVEEFSPADAPRRPGRAGRCSALAARVAAASGHTGKRGAVSETSDPQYRNFLPAANSRTQLSPALRAVCRNERAVVAMIDWVVSNNLTFAVRCGGHSYEGFSQSSDVVIDLRGWPISPSTRPQAWSRSAAGHRCSTSIRRWRPRAWRCRQEAVRPSASPAISMGGGHGLLARSHGLTCDPIKVVPVLDSQSRNSGRQCDIGGLAALHAGRLLRELLRSRLPD